MTCRAAALLLALALPAAAQPDSATVDFGHAVPGQTYYYVAYYRNTSGQAMTVGKDPGQCGSCPNLQVRFDPVAPGDSTPLRFKLFLDPGTTDSAQVPLGVMIRRGEQPAEQLVYTLRIDATAPRSVVLHQKSIAAATTPDSLISGGFELTNAAGQTIKLDCIGAPPGLRFAKKMPLKIKAGHDAAIEFQCRPEALLGHRSLTFRVMANGSVIERFSLPVAAK